MPYPTAERESSLTTAEERAASVECLPSTLQQIREIVLEVANRHRPVRFEVSGELFGKELDINCRLPFRPREVEVCGVLFGEREKARVRILAFRPLVSDQAVGRAHTLSERDRQALVALIAAAQANPDLHRLQPVGWFRAHSKGNSRLSKRDLEVFEYFFNEPWQIGLILGPAASASAGVQCFLRDIDGSIRPPCELEEVVAPATLGDTTVRTERLPPSAPPLPWQPQTSPALAAPISWVVLLLGAVLGLAYWWMQASQQDPFQTPYRRPQVSVAAEPNKKIEQAAATLWKKWEEELRRKQEVAALREQLERQGPLQRPEELPARPLKLPPAPIRTHPPTVRRSGGPLLSTRRSFRPPAQKLPQLPLVSSQRPPTDSGHLTQSSPALMIATPAPPRPAVDSPLTTPPALSIPPRQKTATDAPVAPQPVARPASPADIPHQEQSSVSPKNSAAPATVSAAPSFGRLIWTGRLPKNGTLIIDGGHPSTGSITAELPGKPVKFSVWPGVLTDGGIVLYTSKRQGSGALESPGPQNGWNKTVYMPNKHHAGDIEVVGLPAPNNSWKRLVLRSKSQTSVILVEWALIP